MRSKIIRHLNSDIICICETHLQGSNQINIDCYTTFSHNRTLLHKKAPKGSGGVAICVKDYLLNSYNIHVIDKNFDGILAIELKHKVTEFTLIIICVYLPPEYSNRGRECENFFTHLLSIVYFTCYGDVLFICGDLNARIGNKNDFITEVDSITSRHSIDTVLNKHGQALIEFLQEGKLCVVNGRIDNQCDNFTCISNRGKSVVDYIMTPHECLSCVTKFKVDTMSDILDKYSLYTELGIACKAPDHSIISIWCDIFIDVNKSEQFTSSNMDSCTNSFKRKLYSFDRTPDNFMTSELFRNSLFETISHFERSIDTQNAIDIAYSNFVNILFKEMDEKLFCITSNPSNRKKLKNSKPYWCEELTILWKNMCKNEKLYKSHKNSKKQRNILYKQFKESRLHFDKQLRRKERDYNRKQVFDLNDFVSSDPKKFWNSIKKLGPKRSKPVPMKVEIDGDIHSDTNTVLNKWKQDFSNLLNCPDSTNNFDNEFYSNILNHKNQLEDEMNNENYICNEFINEPIRIDEVYNVVTKLKNKKSVGIDQIPNEVLKNGNMLSSLHKLLYICFENSVFPSDWNKCIITPIPKGSDKNPYLPLNYRGISLNSCISKVLNSILNSRITQYCNDLNIIVDEQNGFRKDRSCEDHIFALTSVIQNYINSNKSIFCAFIDLQKAFDWIDRDLLLYKLLLLNIDGKIYNAVKVMYTKTLSCVKINTLITQWFSVSSGVKQGDTLSPTLFSLYINDLAQEIKNLNLGVNINGRLLSILLYADDMVLIATCEKDLQEMLNAMNIWCSKWRLHINEQKSQIVHFRKKRKAKTNYNFKFGNMSLNVVSQYKYLGIVLDEHLTFDECVESLSQSGFRALGGLISKFKILKNVSFKTFSMLYNSGVIPVLDYGSGIWSCFNMKKSNLVTNKAARYFLGVHKFAANAAIQGDMGWLPDQFRQKISVMRLWNKFVSMSHDRLTYKIFEWDYTALNNNWCSEVHNILESADLTDIFLNKEICDLELLKEKLCKNCEDRWNQSLLSKPKLRSYRKYKLNFETEPYVSCYLSRYQRSLLAKFRLGILPLRIETGRFNLKTDPITGKMRSLHINERVCQMCDLNVIEDEEHFLLKCPCYEEIRKQLYVIIRKKCNNFDDLEDSDKFVVLNSKFQNILAKYIALFWEKRSNILFV